MAVRDKVAQELCAKPGIWISGSEMAQKFSVSRNAVWKAVDQLREEGYPIESVRAQGYRLTDPDFLSVETITPYLRTDILGRTMEVYQSIDSTNTRARAWMHAGAPHGAMVVANGQTGGQGRHGKSFQSPAGTGLYFTLILRQSFPLDLAMGLTGIVAVGICRAIDNICGCCTDIKWVNDLYLHDKKICGILTESDIGLESGEVENILVGIGINIRDTKQTMPADLQDKVTSLEEELPQCKVQRGALLAACLRELEYVLRHPDNDAIWEEYRNRSMLIGRTVLLQRDNGEKKRVAVIDVDRSYGLLVRDRYGDTEVIRTGSIEFIPQKI